MMAIEWRGSEFKSASNAHPVILFQKQKTERCAGERHPGGDGRVG